MNLFGAVPTAEGVRFGVWAPEARSLALLTRTEGSRPLERVLERRADGVWTGAFGDARTGDRYAYSIDGGVPRPDPASRFQPDGVHGWSEIVDPGGFEWSDGEWRGPDPARAVIYELHVGTFSPDTAHSAASPRGWSTSAISASQSIELMPLAEFPGRRNWGYDGVCLFAPSHAYGRPDDLRALVNRAHALGLAVMIDVVYNHLGPEGAYLPAFRLHFFTDRTRRRGDPPSTWTRSGAAMVRDSHRERDALDPRIPPRRPASRRDACAHRPERRTFVAELAAAVQAATSRRLLVFAEDHRNLAKMVRAPARRRLGTRRRLGRRFPPRPAPARSPEIRTVLRDYQGTTPELADTLASGWLYTGQ